MDNLQFYNDVFRDIHINSLPRRDQKGNYLWPNGQEKIISKPQFKELRKYKSEIEQLKSKKELLTREMLMYQDPANFLDKEGDELAKSWQKEIDEEKLKLNNLNSELEQFDEDMFNRGYFIEENTSSGNKPFDKEVNTKKGINWKVVFRIIGIWIIGEIFMTYVQWNALRDEKGLEDLLVRSLAFGVTLFLLHFIAHKNQKSPRRVFYVYICFNLLMLVIMLFAPLAVSKLYPIDLSNSSVQDIWSLTDQNNTNSGTSTNDYPFWVEFYRSNEVTPAILCFIFFIAMESLISITPKKNRELVETKQTEEPFNQNNGIQKKRKHFKARIKESENTINNLQNKLTSALASNTAQITNVLTKLEKNKAEIIGIDVIIDSIKIKQEELFKNLEKELNLYKAEFVDILQNDQIKSNFIKPEWPDRKDIIQYLNL